MQKEIFRTQDSQTQDTDLFSSFFILKSEGDRFVTQVWIWGTHTIIYIHLSAICRFPMINWENIKPDLSGTTTEALLAKWQ